MFISVYSIELLATVIHVGYKENTYQLVHCLNFAGQISRLHRLDMWTFHPCPNKRHAFVLHCPRQLCPRDHPPYRHFYGSSPDYARPIIPLPFSLLRLYLRTAIDLSYHIPVFRSIDFSFYCIYTCLLLDKILPS